MTQPSPNQLWALLAQIMRLECSIMYNCTDSLDGIHPGQVHLLLMLSQQNGASQKDLASSAHVSAPTVTVMLDNLKKKNLITKKKDSTDRRITRIYLTPKGQDKLDKIRILKKKINEGLLHNISLEEQLLLNHLLQQIRNNLLQIKDNELMLINHSKTKGTDSKV
ncbi:MAG: MarR family winged helix-turn-helix transcriptional regulator [Bacillota bacterium]